MTEIPTTSEERRLRALVGCTHGAAFEFDRECRYLGIWTTDDSLLARPRTETLGATVSTK